MSCSKLVSFGFSQARISGTLRRCLPAVVTAVVLVSAAPRAHADMIVTPTSGIDVTPSVTAGLLSSVATITTSGGAIQANWSQNLDILKDGNFGPTGSDAAASAASIGIESTTTSITYTFDTATNQQGYDITGIRTFAGWFAGSQSTVRSNQGYQISLTFVDRPTATLQQKTSYPYTWADNATLLWTGVAFANSTGGALSNNGVTATGVAAITFSNFDLAGPGGPVAYREIAIDGVASVVPEPSQFLLCVSGLVGLLAYAWRKRR